jgi:hypothetical protein
MIARLPLISGLTLVWAPNGANSDYDSTNRQVVIHSGSPVGGYCNTLAHELNHAHQHRVLTDAGFNIIPNDPNGPAPGMDPLARWADTREGAAFIAATGWTLSGGAWIAPPSTPGGWNPPAGGPWEDAAEFGGQFFDPGRHFPRTLLQTQSPSRYAWAQAWLPRPTRRGIWLSKP